MSNRTYVSQYIRNSLAVLTICALLVGGVPKKTEAQGLDIVQVIGGIGTIQDTISATANSIIAGLQQSLILKEFTLDGIAWSMAKKVLADMVQSTIDWVNTGNNGKPVFVTNYDDYFLETADAGATEFIQQGNFEHMCQELQQPVRQIVDQAYREARSFVERTQCELDDGTSGDNFPNGLQSWFAATTRPQNNVYGNAVRTASAERNKIEQDIKIAEIEANQGKGYLPQKSCVDGTCVITTPGDAIAAQLNFALQIPGLTLIEADDINEIIGGLFAKLGNQALSGINGLLGLSYSPDGVSPSYLSQMYDEANSFGFTGSDSFLTDAIADENVYIAVFEKAIGDLDDHIETLEDLTCSQADRVLEDALDLLSEYLDEIDNATSVVEILTLLLDTFRTATDEQLQIVIVEEFERLRSGGLLHSNIDTTRLTFDIADEVTDIEERTDAAERSCN